MQRRDKRMKIGSVVHVNAVRHFMRNGRAADIVGRKDEPPAIAYVAGRGTASPARFGISDTDPGNRDAVCRGQCARLAVERFERGPFQKSEHACGHLFAWTADAQTISDPIRTPWICRIPVEHDCIATKQKMHSRNDRLW